MPASIPDRHLARLRALRRGSRPTVSVVLVAQSDTERARGAVEALLPQCARIAAELVVVTRSPADLAQLARSNPAIRLVGAPAESTVAHMRVLAAAECAGDILAFIDDQLPIPADWINALTTDTGTGGVESGGGPAPEAIADTASAK